MSLEQAELCRACALGQSRKRLVWSSGDPASPVAMIGEGPGDEEDQGGIPFVGPAGLLLDRILHAAGFQRAEIYLLNLVKCRPPQRPPSAEEISTCTRLWLEQQLSAARPRIIVPLGSLSCRWFLGSEASISKERGRWHSWRGISLFPMFHPAYLLRNESHRPGSPKHHTWADIRALRAAVAKLQPGTHPWEDGNFGRSTRWTGPLEKNPPSEEATEAGEPGTQVHLFGAR